MNIFLPTLALLVASTLLSPQARRAIFNRTSHDWWVDSVSAVVELFIIGGLQIALVLFVLNRWFPHFRGVLAETPLMGIFLSMFVVDYCWYWNHRVLHAKTWLWNTHAAHHSAHHLDVFATTRNSVWSQIFMVYNWLIPTLLFVISGPYWFFIGRGIARSMSFWNHTRFEPKPGSKVAQMLSLVFITPHQHHWHHNGVGKNCNFGTVFSIWDRLHGTHFNPQERPAKLGYPFKSSPLKELLILK